MSPRREHKHAAMLVAVVLGMFGFAFAMVPLYQVFCDITGINGRTAGRAADVDQIRNAAAAERKVTIQFLGKVARGMPWEFQPADNELRVRVGEMQTATFHARNRSGDRVTGQAVPSVSPGQAALYLKKVECFCFERQVLDGGEEIEMPVTFVVSAELPTDIKELSLAYTMFRVDDAGREQLADKR